MSNKVRVYEVAKELGVPSKELVEQLKDRGVDVKTHASTITEELAQQIYDGWLEAPGGADGEASGGTSAAVKEAPPKAKEKAPAKEPPPKAKEKAPAKEPPPKAKEKAPAKEPPPKAKEEAPEEEAPPEEAPEPAAAEAPPAEAPAAEAVHVPRGISVQDFAEKLEIAGTQIVQMLVAAGSMKTITQSMTDEEILVVADELGVAVEIVEPEVEERLEAEEAEADLYPPESVVPRPPVVTVMGHVDHGKTTVLDRIRESNVVAKEHGGITQHIGAYQVLKDGNAITFLDTPGHEAFTAMRARGAGVTDIAILVVAADDGVKPQTVEALDHARAAGVPIIIAVNKIDKPEADPVRVRTELSEYGLQPEEWGGDALFVDVSAKTGENLDDLLTGIVLVADDLGLEAPNQGPARGTVLEAHLDKGRGSVATVLVKQGTLRVGDVVVAGTSSGKIRAMLDEWGNEVEDAGPARPVLTLGWNTVPEAGDEVRVVPDEKTARQTAQEREAARRQAELVRRPAVSLEELLEEVEELNLVLKADVQGSLGAVKDALEKLDVGDVNLKIIHSAVGAISGSDITLAKASDAIVVGFNVRPDANAREAAERDGVEVRTYRVIYELLEEIERALKGLLKPTYEERVLGAAEIRETFRIPRGLAAGCYVTNGEIRRNASARLLRDGTVVYEGKISSLRRFKEDVRDVQQGFECGIGLENFNDIKIGDVIEAYEVREILPV